MSFCIQRKTDPFSPAINLTLEFLLKEFKNEGKTRGYSAMNTIRSAISSIASIEGQPVGQHLLVKRFMKAVFREKPALPRYKTTWDPDVVLNHIKSLGKNDKLTIIQVSRKLTMLLLLLSGQRCQTIHSLNIKQMALESSKVTFVIKDLLKTSRPGKHLQKVSYKAYAPDRRLCVVTTLKHYIERTKIIRKGESKLLISTRPPYKASSKDTIRRWTSDLMQAAGINTKEFGPHSTRHASSSKAAQSLSLQEVADSVGWTNQSTYAMYYKRPIVKQLEFSEVILENV